MIEYYDVYRQSTISFNENNPKKRDKPEIINFKIHLLNRKINISVNKENSLEDLYISIYNAVYPEFSTEKNIDIIPPAGISNVPRIYNVSLNNEKTETIHTIPLHKFITISSYMKSNPGSFASKSIFGKKFYTIYVIDEYAIANLDKCTNNKNNKTLFQMMFSCYYSRNIDTSTPR
jgi:hypothetical protein